jgi:predicted dehydrogenase
MVKGIHVFVEKPMALNKHDAERMVSVARDTGMRLGVSHNLLFSRSVRGVQRRLESGRLGQVRHVLALQASSPNRRLPHWYPQLRGGLFFDEAPHMIYLIESLLGGLELRRAWAGGGGNEPNSIGVEFRGQGGVQAELTMIFESPISEWLITVFCEKGVLVLDLFRDIQFMIRPDGGHKPFEILGTSLTTGVAHAVGTLNTGTRYLLRRQFWGHDVIIPNFLASVRSQTAPVVTGEDGARVVSTLIDILDKAGL